MKKKRGDIFLSQYAMLREDIIVYPIIFAQNPIFVAFV